MAKGTPFFLKKASYVLDAYISPDQLQPYGVWIKFDPPTNALREEFQGRFDEALDGVTDHKERARAGTLCIAQVISEHLKSWEFEGVNEQDTPKPTAELISAAPPTLFRRLQQIVLYGIDGGDTDPRSKEKTAPDSANDQLAEKQGN